jgi:hypothetical protein
MGDESMTARQVLDSIDNRVSDIEKKLEDFADNAGMILDELLAATREAKELLDNSPAIRFQRNLAAKRAARAKS